ncbi:MAG: phenylalanine--tRNA ligase subunit alpha, partial [Oscillospiraceae bacterium]|nr:phenylalanine--tRNA ligase subunit alpha [Oscillospiraceae bacterium]
MKQQLEQIRSAALAALAEADTKQTLENARIRYLGKKGEITAILKQMGKLSAEERPVIGQLANQIRAEIEDAINTASKHIEDDMLRHRLKMEALDVTIPGTPCISGHKHPMSILLDEAKDIFLSMGFTIAEGPEVELSDYNFTRLNTSDGHPARDRRDTFYFTDDDSVCL